MVMEWGYVLTVLFTGLVVVFAALVILIAVVSLFGKIIPALESKKKTTTVTDASDKAAAALPAAPVAPAMTVEDGIEEEVVAAIAAAIAMANEGKAVAIRSIRRSGRAIAERNPWHFAGIQENTRAF